MSTQPSSAAAKTEPGRGRAPGPACRRALRREIHKVIIGQEQMIEQMLICLFARGHCLPIGVPGLAKTLMVSTLAQALHLNSTASSSPPT